MAWCWSWRVRGKSCRLGGVVAPKGALLGGLSWHARDGGVSIL